jgi:hypothetical protein
MEKMIYALFKYKYIYFVIYIMKVDRNRTIQLIRMRIIELDIINCSPQLESYTAQQLIKVCSIYGIKPYYHE